MPFVLTTGQRHEATPFEWLTERAVRRASAEFASTGPQYALDKKIWAMLGFGPCQEVNTETSMVEDSDIEDLRAAGWGEQGVYEATALISLLITVVGRKQIRGCRWVGYQKKRDCLRQLSVRLPRRRRAPGRIQRVHAIRWKRA